MKRLDLNIKLDEKVMKQVEDGVDKAGNPKLKAVEMPAYDVAIQWIAVMIERSINRPKIHPESGRMAPTVEVAMAVHRRYAKVMDALEAHKEGIVDMEEEDFSFLESHFNKAEISVQRDINKILIRLDDVINKAKTKIETKGV